MELFNTLCHHLNIVADETCAAVNGLIDTVKIRTQICERQTNIKLAYRTLGELLYHDHATGSDNTAERNRIFTDIDRWNTEIEALRRIYKQTDNERTRQTQEQTKNQSQKESQPSTKEQIQNQTQN